MGSIKKPVENALNMNNYNGKVRCCASDADRLRYQAIQ